jgi:hypothetical protein
MAGMGNVRCYELVSAWYRPKSGKGKLKAQTCWGTAGKRGDVTPRCAMFFVAKVTLACKNTSMVQKLQGVFAQTKEEP